VFVVFQVALNFCLFCLLCTKWKSAEVEHPTWNLRSRVRCVTATLSLCARFWVCYIVMFQKITFMGVGSGGHGPPGFLNIVQI